MADLKLCYNKGCSKQFDAKNNHAKACTFHPGEPYFHDAYKEWTCCKKKSVDFTEFLNYKGCQVSFHNDVRPVVETPKPTNIEIVEQSVPKPPEPMQRPSVDSEMIRLKAEVSASLTKALAAELQKLSVGGDGDKDDNKAIKIGDPCQNRGCGKTFSGSLDDICLHHLGFPVFHEGMKYWSCCQRKTSEFEVFLKQEGCERSTHVWKKLSADLKNVACRTDWHQTGLHVYANFYAKNCDPDKSVVKINAVKMHIRLVFGESVFEKEMLLGGIIDVEKSQVTMTATKVEVKLKKAEVVAWKALEMPKE